MTEQRQAHMHDLRESSLWLPTLQIRKLKLREAELMPLGSHRS